MTAFVPMWIIGGPFFWGPLILSFSFKGPSSMGGPVPRFPPRGRDTVADRSAPMLDSVALYAPRRFV